MPTSAPGSSATRTRGFTLIEVMVVLAIVAIGAGLISLAIRDPAETRLEHEAMRLSALLESARTEARAGGFDVAWVPGSTTGGAAAFRFVGLPPALALPTNWLTDGVSAEVVGSANVVLGPDAILPPQRIVLRLEDRRLEIGSDGIAGFAVVVPADDRAAAP